VEKIRKTVTYAHGTSFDPVIKAYADLRNRNMETFFGIRINAAIKVCMAKEWRLEMPLE
jgi:hypothetical protein